MSDLREQLLRIYSQGSLEEVHARADYQALCEHNEGDYVFDQERNRVAEMRNQVDQYLNRNSLKQEVRFALRLTTNTEEDREVARELVVRSLAHRWSDVQREYFNSAWKRLCEGRDYFLSFTQRNNREGEENRINQEHRFFIINRLGQDRYDAADLKKQNLLAEAVHVLLGDAQLDGFFYPEHKGDNSVVEAKLRAECKDCFAFVQLAQAEMFRLFKGSANNWCRFEFDVASESGRDILFVKVDIDFPEGDIHVPFQTWFDSMEAKDAVELQRSHTLQPAALAANYAAIRDNLAAQVRRSRERIYAGVP